MPLKDTDAMLWFGGHSNFTEEDDDSGVILRLARPRAGEARLMVGVEFSSEDNEIVGKVYDAESQLKYATEPRDAHLAGSIRATVSRLLRESAPKVGGDRSF